VVSGSGSRHRSAPTAGWLLGREPAGAAGESAGATDGHELYVLADGRLAHGPSREACVTVSRGSVHDDGAARTRDLLRRAVRAAGGEPGDTWPGDAAAAGGQVGDVSTS
jgi:hypothetical protein